MILSQKVGQPFPIREGNTNESKCGRPLKQVARELGVSAGALRSWRDRRIGTRSEGVAETQGTETLQMKVKRLERENAYLRRQREILKKAASILAEDPQGGMR